MIEFEDVESKIRVLHVFVENLRKSVDPKSIALAESVDKVLRECNMEEIEKAFDMLHAEYGYGDNHGA